MEPCSHPRITEILHRYPASRDEPAEIVGMAVCSECGKVMDLEDVPEGAKIEIVWQ